MSTEIEHIEVVDLLDINGNSTTKAENATTVMVFSAGRGYSFPMSARMFPFAVCAGDRFVRIETLQYTDDVKED